MFAYYSSHSVQCTLIVQYAVDKMLLQGLQSVSESKLGKCPETLGYEPFVHASAAPENLLASPQSSTVPMPIYPLADHLVILTDITH